MILSRTGQQTDQEMDTAVVEMNTVQNSPELSKNEAIFDEIPSYRIATMYVLLLEWHVVSRTQLTKVLRSIIDAT